jgi:hypothetical protein
MATESTVQSREIFFEITRIGATAKVAAIDGVTGLEVCVVGPAHAAEHELRRLAVAKLQARLIAES